MIILAIDPGATTGWAVGSPGSQRLLACGICYPDKGGRPPAHNYDLVIIEKPVLTQVGPGSITSRGNDLITCWGRGCKCVESVPHKRLEEVAPGTWKGQVPKVIHNARVLAKLTATELALCSGNHNEIDAIGLLLYALERWFK
jgi:hypothetical protein